MESIVNLENATIAQHENIVLTDVNLRIEPGEFIYLVGKTGSGKSSLLKTLYGELPIEKGAASVCGYDMGSIKRKHIPFLRRKLGIVFQDFELLTDRSVHENLKFVLRATGWKSKSEMDVRIDQVLFHVGLQTKGFKMPHELSGGEQQRVAIARALLNEPDLILADEPTGNLDPTTTAGILQLLHDISKEGKAVLMATHDYAGMKKFNSRTIICSEGKVKEATEVGGYTDFV